MKFSKGVLDSGVQVAPSTILIDPHIKDLKQNNILKRTLIHECVHGFKHQKVFELKRLYNSNLNIWNFQADLQSLLKTRII